MYRWRGWIDESQQWPKSLLPPFSLPALSLADVIVTGRLVSGALRSKEEKKGPNMERVAGKGLQRGRKEKKKWGRVWTTSFGLL